ncbi:MAG TPA: GeoRSP system radical SAM/SPASM protein [Candidatus Methanoperedens sp.]|nr:GeoRSP system radical SAM/SPASM protein [Candidatus Methanoperedens sp.]
MEGDPEAVITHLSSPVTVNWGITARCNFVCSHCFSRLDPSEELSPEDALRVVDILAGQSVMFLNYGTGEPLLRRDLFALTSLAVSKGLKVTMNSNGSLLDAAAARRIREAGFHSVGISIDSATPATHDAFRRMPGSFEKAVRAARLLREEGVPLTVSSVICKVNHRDFPALVTLAKELGAHTIDLHNFKCSGMGGLNKEALDLSPDEWRRFYEAAVPMRDREKGIDIAFDDPILSLLGAEEKGKLVAGSVCGKLSLYIKPNGEITPCGFIPVTIGHILRDDFAEVWHGSKVLEHLRNKAAAGKCSGCAKFSSCLGGCTARAYAVYGAYDAPDPHCWSGD